MFGNSARREAFHDGHTTPHTACMHAWGAHARIASTGFSGTSGVWLVGSLLKPGVPICSLPPAPGEKHVGGPVHRGEGAAVQVAGPGADGQRAGPLESQALARLRQPSPGKPHPRPN